MLEPPKASCTNCQELLQYVQYLGESENQGDETMDNQQERLEKKIGWLTGIIEGEGWVSLTFIRTNQKNGKFTNTLQPQIGIANTDLLIIDEIKTIFDYLKINYRFSTRKATVGSDFISRKQRYEISCASKRDLKVLIPTIYPYMIGEKKERAQKLLKFFSIRDQRPTSGPNSKYGSEEFTIYKELYSYKGTSRSRILNDYTPEALSQGYDIV